MLLNNRSYLTSVLYVSIFQTISLYTLLFLLPSFSFVSLHALNCVKSPDLLLNIHFEFVTFVLHALHTPIQRFYILIYILASLSLMKKKVIHHSK